MSILHGISRNMAIRLQLGMDAQKLQRWAGHLDRKSEKQKIMKYLYIAETGGLPLSPEVASPSKRGTGLHLSMGVALLSLMMAGRKGECLQI